MNHSKQNLKLLKINEYYIYKYIYIYYITYFLDLSLSNKEYFIYRLLKFCLFRI